MQLLWEPRSVQWKIAILIIALVLDVSCIRNGNGDEKQISVKLKNFFPSEEVSGGQNPTETSARVTSGGGFRPSQMLDFTPSDVMPQAGFNRYPPSYLEPNYKREVPNSVGQQQTALDKQFSFPEGSHSVFQSTPLPTTPVVSYLDPYTQQNYRYTPTPPSIIQYQREQPAQDDQVYTVQSSLLVGSHQQNHQNQRPGHVEDVYLKRPGYVFDESPAPSYRRPTRPPPSLPAPPTTASQKISYDSHDYPPPSYAAEQTSNFVPQQPKQRPLYQRQDINANRGGGGGGGAGGVGGVGGPPPPGSSNYANNFDNYSQRPNTQQTQIQNPSQVQPQFGNYQYQYNPQNGVAGGPAGGRPGSGQPQRPRPGHNYYEYQIGEIPPPQSQHFQQPQQQQFNYRPATQSPGGGPGLGGGGGGGGVGGGGVVGNGLATLASLYAPQFTNLLLGGGGSPSSSSQSASPLGSLLGAFAGTQGAGHQSGGQGGRPPNTQLIRALENIARNDDLQCVPKVLCQMIAGQTLRGQLPGFVTSPAITNFLAGFPVASPALIYGRAALLGLSGGERSCIQTYEKCPKNDMEIIHYLNNHRGGFFKFFSEPEETPVASQQGDGGTGSLFSILSALTGGGGGGGGSQSYTTPRPPPRPTQRPSTDIASGIGSFFTQVLSEYLNGVEYQRRRRRRSLNLDDDFHDEEDNLDTQTSQLVKFQDDEEEEAAKAHTELIGVLQFPEEEGEGRVINFKDIQSEEQHEEGAVRFPDATPADVIRLFNRNAAQRKLRFPQDQDEPSENVRKAKELSFMEGWKVVLPNGLSQSDLGVDKRRGKRIVFRDTNEHLDEQRLQEERIREEELFREAELREERMLEEEIREQKAREELFREEQIREQQLREEEQIREQQLREEELREIQEEQIREDRIQRERLQIQRIREAQNNQQSFKDETPPPPNAVYEDAAPPQRGARVIFPDHYEQHIRKGKILNRPTYAPTYEYNEVGQPKEDRLVVSDEHRAQNHYRLEGGFNSLNHGEYMPGNTVRFGETTSERPHYNYPNANYISDNRYGSSQNQKPHYEDDKNIYVTNSQGVNEYYIRPDGGKVYLKTG
ncbi:uncharacterized protein LOC108047479 [Drosophila rhopaloa]|uniref:Uncharacterized protein n=1 Tax=Drosophila rhopaloa TaxID=1041015 RepID=A0ABM5J1D9_DRORH|nr:uncharacterized protein LOC108047479 [Drosophila rhopaloa]XP_044312635.1 uncharacterized protein LOC108047479 [Drosophila rhopaloa]